MLLDKHKEYVYGEARKLLEKMGDKDIIKQYVEYENKRIAKMEEDLEEYREVFKGIAKFTNKRQTIYK